MNKVSILGCKNYDTERLTGIVKEHFNNLDFKVVSGAKILIKPNLLMASSPSSAVTTHPAFVAAVCLAVRDMGGIPIIAESSGGMYTAALLKNLYRSTGILEIAEKYDIPLNYDTSFKEIRNQGSKICGNFKIISPFFDCDGVISVGKLKTHSLTYYTGATKNLFGLVPGLTKPQMHLMFPEMKDFAQMLIDLCETIKPCLALIDGITALEGNGPSGGNPRHLGVTIASKSTYSADVAACSLIGFDPLSIPYLKAAYDRGLVCDSVSKLSLSGDSINDFICKTFVAPDTYIKKRDKVFLSLIPSYIRELINNYLRKTQRPRVIENKCIGCGECARTCPAKTIKIQNRKAKINYDKCIKCYCCQELCPAKAIKIK